MSAARENGRERLNVVIAGHVDHGKSTVVGRLLADTKSLPKGKLQRIKDFCERNSKPFEYAFLLDALKDERSQGITIDAARIFFKTALRDYMIFDAPGHIEFLKNMVSGASHASAGLLVIDAEEGVCENSRRHGTLLAMLGVRQVAVLVNKMDLVRYERSVFEKVAAEYKAFLREIGLAAQCLIPVSGLKGENIAASAHAMPWYKGKTVVDALDAFLAEPKLVDKSFRMPVQDVYKFAKRGDDRRIIAGTVASGTARKGDRVVFYPSGKGAAIRSVEGFPEAPEGGVLRAGIAAGFTLDEQIYVRRGEVAVLARQARPQVASRLETGVFWLGRRAFDPKKEYLLKIGTAKVRARLEQLKRVLDASSLRVRNGARSVERHEIAECVIATDEPVAFDPVDTNHLTGRFVLIDDYEISGGGLIRKGLDDAIADAQEKAAFRELKWQRGFVPLHLREKRYGQKASLLIVTGAEDDLRKKVAKGLEKALFDRGRHAYYLGIGSVLYGLDADLRGSPRPHEEDIRRLAETAHILLDSGLILVVTAANLTRADIDLLKAAVDPKRIKSYWIGGRVSTDAAPHKRIEGRGAAEILKRIVADVEKG